MYKDFNKYEVFENGRIWSYKTKRFLKPVKGPNGYQQVHLSDNEGKIKWYYLHRVVWEAVTGSPIPKGYEINHISEAKDENFFENLQLVSHKENCNYGTRNLRAAKGVSKANTNNPKRSKMVGAFKNGNLVMTFPSTAESGRQGFNQSSVAACCRNCYNREGNNVYKGYTWKYL